MRFLKVYGRVLSLLRDDIPLAVFLLIANILVAGLLFLEPVLFGRVVDLLSRSARISRTLLWQQASELLSMWAVVGFVGILSNMLVALYSERLAHRHRLKAMSGFFGHVLNMPLSFHGDTHSGRLMKMMISGSEGLFVVWLTFFREQFATLFAVGILLPMTLILNWRLALTLIVLVVVFCVVTTLVMRHTEAGQRRVEAYNSTLAGTAQDALANVMVVQSFTQLRAEAGLFADIANQVIKAQFPVLNWWAVVNVSTRAASTIAVIAIVIIGTLLHISGRAGVGEIVSFMGFATLLIGRLESGVSFASSLFFRIPSLEDFFGILDAKSSVPEKPGAKTLVPGRGEVAFENVAFAYPGGKNILTDMGFVARPGTSTALVGQTGAGKSTAMNLLQRLWDPSEGRILIDGQDLRDVTLESLRGAIGVVFQEALLFNRTIRDNLRMGAPNASDEELERACRLADAHKFIMRQPQGYATMIGERGSTLSGGQRQRLAIARALLKNPPILILDEATSALDAATEVRVSRALKTLMQGRTTFIIAHRLSTVRDADVILVFDGGRIVEQGSFDSLIALGGRFADLVQSQLAAAPPAPQARAAE